MLKAIPCTLMRGGTSKGPYFQAADLPGEPRLRDQVLLAAMGSPDERQIDGIGGATTLTSKVAIVSPSEHPQADVDYLFAQVSIEKAFVDTAPSCGNILSGVGPFAIESGLVKAQSGETRVRIFNINTRSLIDAVVQTPAGQVEYEGSTAIDGVPGAAAPVRLDFREITGSKTGAMLPTGNARDTVQGIDVSCVDVAVPMVLVAATSLGKTGYERKSELDQDTDLLGKLESIRREAAALMGMGDVSDKVIPKVALLASPVEGGTICSRYFVPNNCHAAHAVTGGICVAVASAIEGSVVNDLARHEKALPDQCVIEHPSGQIEIMLDMEQSDGQLQLQSAGVIRTARKLFSGEVYVPQSLWQG